MGKFEAGSPVWVRAVKSKMEAVAYSDQGFFVGERVERRDAGEEWRAGYVTSVTPLKVTFDVWDTEGSSWDEVRKIEELRMDPLLGKAMTMAQMRQAHKDQRWNEEQLKNFWEMCCAEEV